ncbi:MAG: LUD domain-containing protein [Bacteroidales bacterium]|jgi:L-lactate dehydrogenase complex protein LldG
MDDNIIKEKVMNSIRNALLNKDKIIGSKTQNPNINYNKPLKEEPEIEFVEQFINNGGKFVFCDNLNDLYNKLQGAKDTYNWDAIFCNNKKIGEILNNAGIIYKFNFTDQPSIPFAFVPCELMIARSGSILFTLFSEKETQILTTAETLIVIARIDKIVQDIKDATNYLKDIYINSLPPTVTILNGPSKTNSIENKFIVGGQGPKEIFLFLVNDKF